MLINAGAPIRSLRDVAQEGEELLMVGGDSHHVGSANARLERYERLVEFARRHWDARDHAPVVEPGLQRRRRGALHRAAAPVLEAHPHRDGFKKWGITSGTPAGMLISDAILDRDNPPGGLFATTRVRPHAGAPRFLLENSRAGAHMVLDRVRERGGRPRADLAPSDGGIVSHDGRKVAGYRDDQGPPACNLDALHGLADGDLTVLGLGRAGSGSSSV